MLIISSSLYHLQEYADFVQLMMEAHNDNPEDNGSRRGIVKKNHLVNIFHQNTQVTYYSWISSVVHPLHVFVFAVAH